MRTRYQAIFFDLDGTLISERAGAEEARVAVAGMLREQGHAVSDEQYSAAARAVIDELLASHGGAWPPVFSRVEVIATTLERLSLPTDAAAALSELYHQTRLLHLTLIAGAAAAVEQAATQHRVGLITNGPEVEQRQKLRRSGLEDRFESVTISGELGVAKPEPAIFERALASLGVEAANAVYVGNNFAADVVGACGAGMDAIWLDHGGAGAPIAAAFAEQAQPLATIGSLRELPAVLGGGTRKAPR